ncbi:MAG: hypothetical protein ACI92E_001750 [Oceanicoccus sp.]|jgi:hypothetical protein
MAEQVQVGMEMQSPVKPSIARVILSRVVGTQFMVQRRGPSVPMMIWAAMS